MNVNEFTHSRIERIYRFLIELASGNLSKREKISENRDDLDAVISGINMLAEELQYTTISNDHLKSIFEGMFDLVIVMNLRGQIKSINSSVSRSLGYSSSELQGISYSRLFLDKPENNIKNIRQKLADNSKQVQFDAEAKAKNGRPITMNCSLSLISEKDKTKGILLIMKDITEQVRIQKALKTRNHELNSFIYRASHDMRGPIASMQGLIHLAKTELHNHALAANYFQHLDKSLFKLNNTVNELLDFGRLSLEEISFHKFYPEAILKEVLQEYAKSEEFDQVAITTRIGFHKFLNSESNILKSILINLIDNSIRYRNRNLPQCKINIHLSNTDTGLIITIKDNGQGMSEQVQQKAFNMFFRGNQDSNGSGLGLYIVKSGIEKLGGYVKMKSKEHNGSIFILYVPDQPEV
jgi:PAS domain S-box-containing protein